MSRPTQICRGFTDEQWKNLRTRLSNGDEDAWSCAVDVFERRIKERFLSCIEALEKADSWSDVKVHAGAPADCSTLPKDDRKQIVVPAFAIMALCCLLIETLQSFREVPQQPAQASKSCSYPSGPCIRQPPNTTNLFKKFLSLPAFRREFDDDKIAKSFVDGIRNGILHEAETRKGWVILRDKPKDKIVEPRGKGYTLNRTEFYKALKREFEKYVRELRDPSKQERRERFLKKMNDIVKEC